MTIDAPRQKKRFHSCCGLSRSLQLVGKFPSIDLSDKAFKGRRPANRFFLMIPWYIVPFFPLKSRRASGFLAPQKKPLLLGKGIYSLEKKHRFPQVFLKIHKSIGYLCPQWICRFLHHLFSPFHHAIHPATSRFACCLILLPQRYSFQLHVQPGRLWKGRVWGMEAHIPETWNIHLLMVLSIGWFRLI